LLTTGRQFSIFLEPNTINLKYAAQSSLVAKLYSQISKTVFVLQKNFRAQLDPELTDLCDALQTGNILDHHKQLLNSRVLTPETAKVFRQLLVEPTQSGEPRSIGIPTSLNSHRNYNNMRYTSYMSIYRKTHGQSSIIMCPAEIWSKTTVVSDKLRLYIDANIPMIGKSPPLLPLWHGTISLQLCFPFKLFRYCFT